ncbi:uncharacterized protein [Rutidosis leptorrhynchoides]|uniref:uncharacterized protein n=1 Tax=Rutidosis leptorrhynchoides TaxID=125765 RepID=UPI003A994A1E
MNVMDSSPFQALALDYPNFGMFTVVNNLWAWVAVITAAVSFWRIKTISGATVTFPVKAEPEQTQKNQRASIDNQESTTTSTESGVAAAAPTFPADEGEQQLVASVLESPLSYAVKEMTKGMKFSVYYEEDVRENEEENDETVVRKWGYTDGVVVNGGGESDLERVMRMRMGDFGWYRCQELTAINGNVVRFWGESGRSNGSSVMLCGGGPVGASLWKFRQVN